MKRKSKEFTEAHDQHPPHHELLRTFGVSLGDEDNLPSVSERSQTNGWNLMKYLQSAFLALYLGSTVHSAAFRSTGAMNTPRNGHTATVLPNGKVLVAGGGEYGTNELASAELYDPATGQWTLTDSMKTIRRGHTATLLPNGLVLVAGGSQSVGAPYAELYDSATETWTGTAPMVRYRVGHTATLLPNGKVLLAGGDYDSAVGATAELFDPADGSWTATGPMTLAREDHTVL